MSRSSFIMADGNSGGGGGGEDSLSSSSVFRHSSYLLLPTTTAGITTTSTGEGNYCFSPAASGCTSAASAAARRRSSSLMNGSNKNAARVLQELNRFKFSSTGLYGRDTELELLHRAYETLGDNSDGDDSPCEHDEDDDEVGVSVSRGSTREEKEVLTKRTIRLSTSCRLQVFGRILF